MSSPLRPYLYERLVALFGKVKFANEAEEMVAEPKVKWVIRPGRHAVTQHRLEPSHSGEYYRVCCPFCRESDFRLWINHSWGLYDPRTRSSNLWLARCFNDTNCLGTWRRRQELWRMVSQVTTVPGCEDILYPGQVVERPPITLPPENFIPVHLLPEHDPARKYLVKRDYDPADLGSRLKVSLCIWTDAAHSQARHRLVVPIYMRGELAGWQARHVSEDSGADTGLPKWWTCPGTQTSRLLYNHDEARHHPVVVVCEGITDVWRVGQCAVGLFGHTMSRVQQQFLLEGWGQGTLVMLLDNDGPASQAQQANWRYWARLKKHFAGGVVLATLPPYTDPGDLTRDEAWALIVQAARDQGVTLPLDALA
jgi:hypothetical protein